MIGTSIAPTTGNATTMADKTLLEGAGKTVQELKELEEAKMGESEDDSVLEEKKAIRVQNMFNLVDDFVA
jgi:hypothetical protein